MVKDPICGMRVDEHHSLASAYGGTTYFFCSPYCQQQFDQQPEQYAHTAPVRYAHHMEGKQREEEEEQPRAHRGQRQPHGHHGQHGHHGHNAQGR